MKENEIRIIGGAFRGRKIEFPDSESLRPTANRIRETLFNWLMHDIKEARCLDLFAGSGALGFEALSRGASEVVFLEKDPIAIQFLEDNATHLKTQNAIILKQNTLEWLNKPLDIKNGESSFDIVFVDPPYTENLWSTCFFLLEKGHFLSTEALIYVESNKDLNKMDMPENWSILKEKRAGNVFYALCKRNG